MEWKLKLDDAGNAVLNDGKPVYVKPDGSEVAIDMNQTNQTISRLNAEAKTHREAKEAFEAKLKSFDSLDPDKAREAMELMSKLDAKKLIDAGQVDTVKAEITKSYEEKLASERKAREEIAERYNSTLRSNAFNRSKFISDKIGVPVDMIEATFGRHFKIEDDGSVRGYMNGQPIYSPDKPGEVASFDEALSVLVAAYPNRDAILKGSGASGSGARPGDPGGARQISRGDFEKMGPAQQAKVASEMREGKITLTD